MFLEKLETILPEERLREKELMDTHTTFRTGGPADYYVEPENREQLAAAGEFASHLGLAFQIRDDMLDVIGDAKTLGKAVGMDEGKNTFVRLYGMDACEKLVQGHTELAKKALACIAETDFLQELAAWLTERVM